MGMKIGVIGAESVGKSTLCSLLAEYFCGVCVEEYARVYVEDLGRSYEYDDVEKIALHQIEELLADYDSEYIFFDTELIVTKIWFEEKYRSVPEWLEVSLEDNKLDYYLLCMPDIAFVADDVRENGDRRDYLTECYRRELERMGVRYGEVRGVGKARFECAVGLIKKETS